MLLPLCCRLASVMVVRFLFLLPSQEMLNVTPAVFSYDSVAATAVLSLKDTKVTAEDLREVEGWESYELRRQKKVEKKIDGNVMLLNGMDDGLERKM